MHKGCGCIKQACCTFPQQLSCSLPCHQAQVCKDDGTGLGEQIRGEAEDWGAKYSVSLPISLLELSPLLLPFSLLLCATEFGLNSKVRPAPAECLPYPFSDSQPVSLESAGLVLCCSNDIAHSCLVHCRGCASLHLILGYIFCCHPLWTWLA